MLWNSAYVGKHRKESWPYDELSVASIRFVSVDVTNVCGHSSGVGPGLRVCLEVLEITVTSPRH
ncbi:hypothetical protein [Salinactinospora qingdaonensis]|uniref:Uncharacterized protein n=1 Tax=Salinactinospora qingdaonensis TaxID=702744 RepID=A0ABP7FN93_9ACTN